MLSPVLFALIVGQSGGHIQYQDPKPTKQEEKSKFHLPATRPMSGKVKLDAFEKRMKMVQDSPFKQIPWRSIGSEIQGGRVTDIAVPLSRPNDIYVAYATGGLWRTRSNGQSWEPLFDNQSAFGIGDIDVSDDGKTIWVGSGEANNQRTSYAGTGVFKSTDSGKTWTNMGLHDSHHIARVVIDRKNPNTVYVAAMGPLYTQGGDRGLYKTTDGGKSWNLILKGDDWTGCMEVAVDQSNPNKVYAMMYERDRKAWNYLESGEGSCGYRSIDGGKTWTKMTGLPSGVDMGRTAFGVAPSKPSTMYAFVDNQGYDPDTGTHDEFVAGGRLTLSRFLRADVEVLKTVGDDELKSFFRSVLPSATDFDATVKGFKDGSIGMDKIKSLMLERNANVLDKDPNQAQIWRSDDSGVTWRRTRPRMGDHGGYYWNEAVVSPFDPEEVYTLGLLCLRSTNGGASWESIARRNHVDHHSLWINPRDRNHMLNGNDGGIYVSYDAGETWTQWNNVAVGQFTTIAVDDQSPYNVYGGLQDNGTLKGPSNYRPGIDPIDRWETIGGGDGSNVAVTPDGKIVYTASQFGAHGGRDLDKNQRWSARKNPARGEPALRYNWLSPLIISPWNSDIIYLGAQRLMRSFDGGRTYQYISDDLTKNRENGDVPYATLTTISESPFVFGQVYVGCDDGSVKFTPDGGQTWKDIHTPAQERWVTRIVASKFKNGRVYCSQNGYRQDEWTPYVWVSEDFGATWKSIASNLPFDCVNTVREDPTDESILYVGTDMGVYVSIDRGGSWIAYGSGLPNTPVHDLVIQTTAKEMVIASHARSVWVSSVDWIYKAKADALGKPFKEFAFDVPSGRDSWPYRRGQDFAEPVASEQNIQLTLFVKSGGSAKWSITDKEGKAVKDGEWSFDNGFNFLTISLLNRAGDPTAKPNLNPPKTAEEALADPYSARRPDYLPKGDYKLKVNWGGETYEKEFTIR